MNFDEVFIIHIGILKMLFVYCMCMCLYVSKYVYSCIPLEVRATFGGWILSYHVDSGVELKSLGLEVSQQVLFLPSYLAGP